MAALSLYKDVKIMKEISNALSDAIFTVCNKIINKAKFDKTYKCRVISQVSDGKYLVMKDNIEHVVSSRFIYNPNDMVTVLLPQNSWTNATIIYPQKDVNTATQLTEISNEISTLSSRIGVAEQSVTLLDTRNDNNTPEWYITNYSLKMILEFKIGSVIEVSTSSGFAPLITITPWHDTSGGYPRQITWFNDIMYHRVGISNTEWGDWIALNS